MMLSIRYTLPLDAALATSRVADVDVNDSCALAA
jgi:hypothetical protein